MNVQIAEITGSITAISESDSTGAGGNVATVTVIRPGFNLSKQRYYPPETLQRDARLFEGAKMYVNHPTAQEEYLRPEGDLFNWGGILKDVRVAEDGSVQGRAFIHHPQLRQLMSNLRENGFINSVGVSIRAICQAAKKVIDDVETTVIESIMEVLSVDFVTEAGAGGGILAYESADVLLARLKKLRPDLRVIEQKESETMTIEELKAELEGKIAELTAGLAERDAKIASLETQIGDTKNALDADAAAAVAVAAKADADAVAATDAAVESALGKIVLPDAAKARIKESFKGRKSADGLEKAIEAEHDYLIAVGTPGIVKAEGERTSESATPDLKQTFKESFLRRGYDEATAEKLAKTAAF